MIVRQSLFDKVAHQGIFTPLEAIHLLYLTTEGRYNGDGNKNIISDYQLKEMCTFELQEDSCLFRQYCELLDSFILINEKAETDMQLVYGLILQALHMRSQCSHNFRFGRRGMKNLKNGISDFVAFSPLHNKYLSYREIFDSLEEAYSLFITRLCIALGYNYILGEMIPLSDIPGIKKLQELQEVRNVYSQDNSLPSPREILDNLFGHTLVQEIIKINMESFRGEVFRRFQGEQVNISLALYKMPSQYFSRCIIDYGLSKVEEFR